MLLQVLPIHIIIHCLCRPFVLVILVIIWSVLQRGQLVLVLDCVFLMELSCFHLVSMFVWTILHGLVVFKQIPLNTDILWSCANSELYRNEIHFIKELSKFFIQSLLVEEDFLVVSANMFTIFIHLWDWREVEYHVNMWHPLRASGKLLGSPLEAISQVLNDFLLKAHFKWSFLLLFGFLFVS